MAHHLLNFFFATLIPLSFAFPSALLEAAARDPSILARYEADEKAFNKRGDGAGEAASLFEPNPTFDAAKQYVDVSKGSGHEYMPPVSGDLRGPCPGLNAFANHNFLPRNGYATAKQFYDTMLEFGLGPNLALGLVAYGGAISGDILSFSIGGKPSLAQAGLTGILANGLIGSHNKYEGDGSPTRPDLYEEGKDGQQQNNYKTVATQFKEMIDTSPGGFITIDSLTEFRSNRFDTQVKKNPYFFVGPVSGLLVQPGAYNLVFRLMANHSSESPRGILDTETAKSWFGIREENGKYIAEQGKERIPDKWYKRSIVAPYESQYYLADLTEAAAKHPKFLTVGGNTGTVDTYTPVDLTDLTGGVYSSAKLLEGNNLACFLFQAFTQAQPDIVLGVLTKLTDAIGKLLGGLACPELKEINDKVLQKYPGYKKAPVYG